MGTMEIRAHIESHELLWVERVISLSDQCGLNYLCTRLTFSTCHGPYNEPRTIGVNQNKYENYAIYAANAISKNR